MNFINKRFKYDYKSNLSLNNYIFFVFLLLASIAAIASIIGNVITSYPLNANIKWVGIILIAILGFDMLRINKFVEAYKTIIFGVFLSAIIIPSWFFGGGDNTITLLYLLLITVEALIMFEKPVTRWISAALCLLFSCVLTTISYLFPHLIERTGVQNVYADNIIQLSIIFIITAASVGIYTNQFSRQHNMMVSLNSSLDNLASVDTLSGVLNRRKILEILETCVDSDTPCYNHLIMMDIDHFKSINDQHGHLVGDEIIHHFAAYVQDIVQICGVVGRYGGDEFMVLLNCTEKEAVMIAKSLVSIPNYNNHSITTSAGMTSITGNSIADKIIFQADGLLYAAKENGRNQIALLNGDSIKP